MGGDEVKNFSDLKKFLLDELRLRTGIKESDLSLLDSGTMDLVEDTVAFDFSLRNDDSLYEFYHDYINDIGKITWLKDKKIVRDWGTGLFDQLENVEI